MMDEKIVFGVLITKNNSYIVIDRELEGKVEGSRILGKKDICLDGENYVFFSEQRVSKRFAVVDYVSERKLWRG